MLEEESFDDIIDNKEFFADFDLDDMSALEEGDLSLLSDPQRIRQLAEALAITPPDPGMRVSDSNSSNPPTDIPNGYNSDNGLFYRENQSASPNVNNNSKMFSNNNMNGDVKSEMPNESENSSCGEQSQQAMPPPLPPVVISPAEIDNITIQLEKNQQCACRDCGKLFNSVWYLKQHAVKHSNDRPFKCKFCMKTYKFRSNLYQHKCPERNRHMGTVGPSYKKKFYTRGIAYTEMYQKGGPGGEGEINPTKGRPSKTRTKELYDHKDGTKQNDVQNTGMTMGQTQLAAQMFGSSMLSNFDDSDQQSVPLNTNGFEISSHYSIMSGSSDNNSQPMFFDNTFAGQQNTFNSEMNNTEGNSEQPGGPNCFDQFGGYDPSTFGQQSSQYGGDYCNSVREKPLSQEYIDAYIQKNRHRVYSCRKCKLVFPSREYLSRHNAYHTSLDSQPFACDQCPQRFSTEKQLSNHFLQHSDNSPHRCLQCYGTFRSALALRRHKDQCRQCYYPPFGVQPRLMVSPSAPLDQYAFVESEDELDINHQTISEEHLNDIFVPGELVGIQRKGTVDSGVGSDCSHSFASSPIRQISYEDNSALMQPPSYPMMAPEFVGPSPLSSLKPGALLKTESLEEEEEEENELHRKRNDIHHHFHLGHTIHKKDDETDSGFRSRLNSLATSTSTTQSCSPPGSSVSSGSDGGSPNHRHKASPSTTGTDQMHYAASSSLNSALKYTSFAGYTPQNVPSYQSAGQNTRAKLSHSTKAYMAVNKPVDEEEIIIDVDTIDNNECVVMEEVDGGVCRTMAQQRKKNWLKTRFTSKDMMAEKKSRLDRLQQWSSSWDSDFDERYSSSTESYYNLSDRDEFSDDATSYGCEDKVDEEHAEKMEEGVVREAVQLLLSRLMHVIVSALVETSRKNKDKAGQQQPNSSSLALGLTPDLGVASASSTDAAVTVVDNNSDVSSSLNTENAESSSADD